MLRRAGATLGCGVVAALPVESCGVAETARVARYLASESAGQCGPCVHGLDAVAGALEALAAGHATRGTLADLDRWLGDVEGRGACRLPDAAVGFVRSAELLPECVRLDDWGYPIVDGSEVPPALMAHARRAVTACPTLALRLERADDA